VMRVPLAYLIGFVRARAEVCGSEGSTAIAVEIYHPEGWISTATVLRDDIKIGGWSHAR